MGSSPTPTTPPDRSTSTSPAASIIHPPSEITALLPPSSASRARTPPTASSAALAHANNHHYPHPHPHHPTNTARKASISARSISGRSYAGSIRHYGAVPANDPSPTSQAPRVSKKGQRRILTTWPLQIVFFTTVFLTFSSLVLALLLFLNASLSLSVKSIPYRGSGFVEFWIAAVGSWAGFGAVLFFSHPSYLYFITTLITLILLIPISILISASRTLRSDHAPLILIPLALASLTLLFSLLSNYLVRRARHKESQRICRMLTDAAGRERGVGEDSMARALAGMQGNTIGSRVLAFIYGVFGLIAGLGGLVVVTLLFADLSISAFDGTVSLPSNHSRLLRVQPPASPWPINIHLACLDPPNGTVSVSTFPWSSPPPTILYTSPSGVPGSLALLQSPLPPANMGSDNPGRWLYDFQRANPKQVGRVCTWDRPGYGFSDVLEGADLGGVADTLWDALQAAGEADAKFLLVGEGYGGLVNRVLAARHPASIHSLLHLDVQTASTYFNENPRGMSPTALFAHRIVTRLLPSIVTPLSITRLPSVLLRRSDSLSRILARVHPSPSSSHLNERLQKARLQESFGSHSRTSASFRALLDSWADYPATKAAIVISSLRRMEEVEGWAEGQESLATQVTSEEGLVKWEKIAEVGHYVCEGQGKEVCERSLLRLLDR